MLACPRRVRLPVLALVFAHDEHRVVGVADHRVGDAPISARRTPSRPPRTVRSAWNSSASLTILAGAFPDARCVPPTLPPADELSSACHRPGHNYKILHQKEQYISGQRMREEILRTSLAGSPDPAQISPSERKHSPARAAGRSRGTMHARMEIRGGRLWKTR